MSSNKFKSGSKKKKTRGKGLSKATRNKFVGGGIAILAVAGIFTGIFMIRYFKKPTLYYGIGGNPNTPDPLDLVWQYYSSFLIQNQITEKLFISVRNGSSSEIVPHLAKSGEWSVDGLNFTCELNEDIVFHDGTPFTADSVKWNIDRLHRVYNTHGILDFAWKFPDGRWVINKTIVVDDLRIRFVLNDQFSPLPALLAASCSNIIKPNSTIENDLINDFSPIICGTGPFRFDSFTENESLVLLLNKNYWNGPNTSFDKIVFKIYFSHSELVQAWQNDEIHIHIPVSPYDPDELEVLNNDPDIIIHQVTNKNDANQIYLNCQLINSSMRKAITYAFNYTSYIDYINTFDTFVGRMETPMHQHLRYSNLFDFELPWCNVSRARQALLDVSWPGTSGLIADDNVSAGNPWETIAESGTPLATYNYTHPGWFVWQLPYESLARDLKQIGVKLIEDVRGSNNFVSSMLNKSLEIFFSGIYADYNDPHSAFTNIFWNTSSNNMVDLNDSQLQLWMLQGYTERDDSIRGEIYRNIANRIMEELYPYLLLYLDAGHYAFVSNLQNIPEDSVFGGTNLKDMYFA